ncbi:MAG: hypothetical protein EXR27_14530 [Betaproteobacteria bacterium]|nr:hypothetical protein [Betaproteobacteria bacterium]
MNESLSARPEARFALVAGIAGGLLAAVISVKAIFGSASSTAGLGFIFVPFIMAAAMAFTGIWGLALGCVWHAVRGTRSYYRAVLLLAWAMTLCVPAYAGWQVWQGLALERAVAEASAMTAAEMEQALDASPWRDNRFFIGALAQNKAASEALLDRIARLSDPELYEPMGSLWSVLGENRKGLAAMRLIAYHPNVGAATLQHLADGPHADKVVHDVLRNRRTPMKVLERYFDSTDYLAEWGLALNPVTPPAVMERLSNSSNIYTRFNLTYNAATPPAILEKLTRDPDETLARHATQALERQAKRLKEGRGDK